jgi:outer membrane protein assembly factor BamB
MLIHRFVTRLTALLVIGSSLVALAGCGSSSTSARAHATATATATRAPTATASPLPDPVQTPTTAVVDATPTGDPSQCSPASTVAPLPTTLTTLYTGDANGTITALNASDGTTRWSYATGETGPTAASTPLILVPSGTILYASFEQPTGTLQTVVVALGSADGSVMWQVHLPSNSSYFGGAALTVVGGVVYAAVVDGSLHALDSATGTERWSYQVASGGIPNVTISGGIIYAQNGNAGGGLVALRASDSTLLWRYATDGYVSMVPVVANGLIYVGQAPYILVALNAVTGAVHWSEHLAEYGLGGAVGVRGAVATGTGLYVNEGRYIYALNASTGALCWVAQSCGQGATSVPLLDGDRLYETCFYGSPGPGSPAGCGAFGLDAHTGVSRWMNSMDGFVHVTPTSLVNNLLYMNATQAQALRLESGTAAWQYPAQESQLNAVTLLVIGGTAYVGLADGMTHALNALDGTPRWSALGIPVAAGA